MKLHIAGPAPDWEAVKPTNRNYWQQMAARTKGVVTPGNAASLIGLVLVLWGLLDIANGQIASGLLTVGLGRLMDLLDGTLAHRTGTKSAFGEAVDATVDKIELAAALLVLINLDILPLLAGIAIAAHNIANVAIAFIAKLRRSEIHPSRLGKIATGFQWGAIGLYIVTALSGSVPVSNVLELSAHISTLISLGFGILATYGYGQDLFMNRRPTE